MAQLRLTLARLLDRGWDAHWVLAQPLYVLVAMLEALADASSRAARSPAASAAESSSARKYVVSPDARAARAARRAAGKTQQAQVKQEMSENNE